MRTTADASIRGSTDIHQDPTTAIQHSAASADTTGLAAPAVTTVIDHGTGGGQAQQA